jgi:hypothetical protein
MALPFAGLSEEKTQDSPKIIFILADDMGYGDIGCYGATRIRTPNIDRLATEGILFTDGHCGASTCTPTRYGLLTGRHNWRTWLKYSALSTSAPLLIEAERVIGGGTFSDKYVAALFNLKEDLTEEENLARAEPRRLSEMSDLLDRWEAEMAESSDDRFPLFSRITNERDTIHIRHCHDSRDVERRCRKRSDRHH